MNNRSLMWGLWVTGMAVIVLGATMTVRSMRKLGDTALRIERKAGQYSDLREMQRDIDRYISAQQSFESIPQKRAVPFPVLMKNVMADLKIDDIRESSYGSVPGWTVRQKEITFNEVSIRKVMECVRKLEADTRPGTDGEDAQVPWQLAKCTIRSSPHSAGMGQVVLVLETIEKEGKK